MKVLREILKILSVPLIFLLIYLTFILIWTIFDWPRGEALITLVQGYFEAYGLWIVFVSALIEGFLVVGNYFPGGAIIFLGVISASGNIPLVLSVVALVSLAFFISYSLNYFVGRYGWYHLLLKFGFKESLVKAKVKLEKHGLNAILSSYWEPNLASVAATASGILQFPFKQFSIYSITGILIWNIFWGVFVFVLGETALKLIGLKYILIVFGAWIVFILVKEFIVRRKLKNQSV